MNGEGGHTVPTRNLIVIPADAGIQDLINLLFSNGPSPEMGEGYG